jgi:hypothetical protein
MFENNNRKVIKDVSVLPATGETRFIYHNTTNGYNYLWNEVEGIFIKVEQSTANFASIVYVNTTTPTTATIFDLNNPPTVNDNSLKNNPDNLYIATDNSTWTYKTSTNSYSTYTVPQSTPFYLANTTTDAGSNKTASIYRTGNLGISTTVPETKLHIEDTTKVLTNNVAGVAQGTLSLVSTDAQAANTGTSVLFGGNYIDSSQTKIAYSAITGRKENSSSANADGYLSFLTWKSIGLTEKMRITSAGNVGIGLSSVIAKFAVNDSAYISALPTTTANLQDNTAFRPHTRFQTTSGVNNNALSLYSTAAAFAIQSHNYSTGVALPLAVQTAGGNFGIGTANPTTILDVQSSGTSNYTSVAKLIAPNNTTAGNATQMNFGTLMSQGNSAEWRFIYQGNNSATNRVDFGMNAVAAPMISYLNNGNVGISNGSPNSKLEVAGSFGAAIRSSATSLTTLSTDYTIVMTAATTVVTLETPSTTTNRRILNIKNGSTGNITITGNIDGTAQTLTLTQKESRTFHSNGSTWWII